MKPYPCKRTLGSTDDCVRFMRCIATKTLKRMLTLASHHCCDPCRATRCRTHNVAANFCKFQDVAGMSRYTPMHPKKDPVASVLPPHCHNEYFNCQRCRGSISKRKRIALHGGGAATLSHVALHCAANMFTMHMRITKVQTPRMALNTRVIQRWFAAMWTSSQVPS